MSDSRTRPLVAVAVAAAAAAAVAVAVIVPVLVPLFVSPSRAFINPFPCVGVENTG